MLQIRQILQLLEKGYSKRKIALVLKTGRHTLSGYAVRIEKTGLGISALLKQSDADLGKLLYTNAPNIEPDLRYQNLESKLDYYTGELCRVGVTKLRLWNEYRVETPNGYGYSQFCEHLKSNTRKNGATMHFDHQPGECIQIDFAGKQLSYVDKESGEIIRCPVLVCVLPYSGYTYIEALASASQELMFAALNRCMSYFGGVPENMLSDNMKQYVNKSSRYEPVFNEVCEQWAVHYNTNLTAARVLKPKDKPSVENTVNVSYIRIYAPIRDETVYSLSELNQLVMIHLELHNHTQMQKRPYSRWDRFVQDEKPLLGTLPVEPFIIKHTAKAKVQKNYHIILGEDWHWYSVPYQYIGKTVTLVYDYDEVEIYLGLQRIAVHKRDLRKNRYTTLKEHMPEGHQKYQETLGWDSDYFLERAKQIGENAYEIMNRILESRTFTSQAYKACQGLLVLSVKYGTSRFENACKRAMLASRVNYRLVDNILTNNLDKQLEEQTSLSFIIPEHENIRGPQAYH